MVFLAAVLNLEGEPPEKELPERELAGQATGTRRTQRRTQDRNKVHPANGDKKPEGNYRVFNPRADRTPVGDTEDTQEGHDNHSGSDEIDLLGGMRGIDPEAE